MKKVRLLFICIFIILTCVTALSSCNKTQPLRSPQNVEIDPDTLILEWEEIKGARLYTVRISADRKEPYEVQRSTSGYSLESLDAGVYSVEVKAVGRENESLDSPWSEPIQFVREVESGMVFVPINGGTEYAVASKGEATGNIVIPDTYRGRPVTEISEKAFFNKSDVTSVKMGKNVRKIGNLAFANCSYLTDVALSDSLKVIGENAFSSCRSLSGELVIPEGVTEIPTGAFSYCGAINSVTFGSQLKIIGVNAFTNCDSLVSLDIPDSVVEIKGYAFAVCSGLVNLNFGESLEVIGEYAFSSLPVSSVTFPPKLKTIGAGAFFGCKELSFALLGEDIVEIGAGAFSDTAMWTEYAGNEVYVGRWLLGIKDTSAVYVDFREDTVGIADWAFYGNRSLTDIVLPDSVRFIGNRAFARSKIINMVIGSGVETVGAEAFAGCSELSTLILGAYDFGGAVMTASSLEKIGNNAFYACEKLEFIKIPSSVSSIGSYAFKKSGIENISDGGLVYADEWLVGYTDEFGGFAQVKSGTVGISDYAFYECSALAEIYMPNSIKNLGRGAFYNCSALAEVRFSEALEVIDDYTFYGCGSYKVTGLPSALKIIGRSAFYKCGSALSGLEASESETDNDVLVIPNTIEYIGDYAFYACGEVVMSDVGELYFFGIDAINIGDSVLEIGNFAFYKFDSLKEISVGNGVISIGDKAFYNCIRLESVTLGEGLRTIGKKAFYKCAALSQIDLPDGLETVGDYAFYKCESLSSSVNPTKLSHIGSFAFSGCGSLTEVVFYDSLAFIGEQAFKDCTGLSSIVLHGGIESIGAHAFYGCFGLTVYSSLSSAPDGWNESWNSSYRPTVWSCTLSEDSAYVVSFEKQALTFENKNVTNEFSVPIRIGYDFLGWTSDPASNSAEYSEEKINAVADGTKLFAVWSEIEEK